MLLSVAAVVLGLVLLVWSADRFVFGASATAADLGVSPLIIGLVIIGFATSSPEMLVATFAAWQGNPGLGIGNAVGSNIANIALILGAAALVRPLVCASGILGRELPLLLIATVLCVALMADRHLSPLDGVLLIGALAAAIAYLARQALRQRDPSDPLTAELGEQIPTDVPLGRALLWVVLGFVLLLIASRMLVWGGVNIASALGVSDLIIGLTIVAVGTSLPELAAAIASVLKQEYDLVLGNVIGSNIFNSLAVLGLPALIHPGAIPGEVLLRDLPVMIVLTLLLIPVLATRRGRHGRIGRIEGALLVSCFIAYEGWLFISA